MLIVEDLIKRYETTKGSPGGGVFGANFTVKEGELFTLLGPSGCGKTTTLRSIAGLEQPGTGRIALAGKDVFNSKSGVKLPGHKRDIGMVFQSYAIWPHMTVFENAAYPLRVAKENRLTEEQIKKKVMATLEIVGLAKYAERNAPQLSGGQQQRLALARALTREPKLLLLDEPLSNLDAQLRDQMRRELQLLQSQAGVTSMYVTHDQSEALAISNRIAVMNAGEIVQLGTPREIYEEPETEFVATFIGRTNLIRGKSLASTGAKSMGKIQAKTGEMVGYFPKPLNAHTDLAVVVRPEDVRLYPKSRALESVPEDKNRISGVVQYETYLGEMVEFSVHVSGLEPFLVRSTRRENVSVNDEVVLEFPYIKTISLAAAK